MVERCENMKRGLRLIINKNAYAFVVSRPNEYCNNEMITSCQWQYVYHS